MPFFQSNGINLNGQQVSSITVSGNGAVVDGSTITVNGFNVTNGTLTIDNPTILNLSGEGQTLTESVTPGSVIQSAEGTPGTTATLSGIGDGHFVAALAYGLNDPGPPAGFTLESSYNNGTTLTNVYLNKNPGAEVSWSPVNNSWCWIYEVAGVSDVGFIASSGAPTQPGGGGTTIAGPDQEASTGSVFLCVLTDRSVAGTWEDPVPSGTVIDFSFNNSGDWVFCAMHNVVASGGSIALGASYGGLSTPGYASIILQPSGAAIANLDIS